MILKIVRSTDGQNLGLVVRTPAENFGEMTKEQIAEMSIQYAGGQFIPYFIKYLPPDRVRLVASSYSVVLEEIK